MPQRHITFASGKLTLEGYLHTPAGKPPWPGIVVCHPHPLYGGDMESSVVRAIVDGVLAQGIAALRFNFRGAGASEGAHDKGMGEREDLSAALKRLVEEKEIDTKRIGLAGYSFGTGVAMAVAPNEPLVQAIALVAPLLTGVNTPAALAYAKPKLLIAGDMDAYVPVEQVHELKRKRMAEPLAIEVIHGADHFFFGHEGRIAALTGDFFKRSL